MKKLSLGELIAMHYFNECEISRIRNIIYKLGENGITPEKKEVKKLKTKTKKE